MTLPHPDLPAALYGKGPTVQPPIELWDLENPRSVINICPDVIRTRVEDSRAKSPDYFGCEEKQLYQILRLGNELPNATDNRLRMMFWLEYDRAQAEARYIRLDNVVSGVCSKQYFTDRYLKIPSKVAWMLTPPASYVVLAQEALQFGLEQLREVLEEPHRDKTGKLDVNLIKAKLAIVTMLDTRIKGAPVQRLLHAHLGDANTASSAAMAVTMADLQEKMKKLEARERKLLNLPEPVKSVVESEEVIIVDSQQSV